ncbi:MAG: hypothetical protein KGJ86_00540 [Chloroflexota bacterium]|nr:hypothetical protein [Chloroflexota bacterium]
MQTTPIAHPSGPALLVLRPAGGRERVVHDGMPLGRALGELAHAVTVLTAITDSPQGFVKRVAGRLSPELLAAPATIEPLPTPATHHGRVVVGIIRAAAGPHFAAWWVSVRSEAAKGA